MAEWLNAAVLKTVKDASPSGVRIPDSPHDLVIYITAYELESTTAGTLICFRLFDIIFVNREVIFSIRLAEYPGLDYHYLFHEIELKSLIKIKFEKDKESAERIIRKSENICLIYNSIKTKIILSPQIIT